MVYDSIIIGSGMAGLTAAIYASRKKMNTLVITENIGGQAALSGDIENYTGYQFITGPELAQKFEEHMRSYDLGLKENEEVLSLKKSKDAFIIKSNKGMYEARTVIIASGKKSKELGVPGEKEFKNKGLSYCATCDAPLFSAKIVAVVGGGNSALDATLQLMHIAKHIYIMNIASSLGADAIIRQKAEESKIVTIMNNTQVTAIIGDRLVSGIKIKKEGLF